MRKVYINNDRSQIMFFHSILDSTTVVLESLDGKLFTQDISNVGMLDLSERENYKLLASLERRRFNTQIMFFKLLTESKEDLDLNFDDIFTKSKELTDKFLQKYNEQ